ncbi:MAG: ABC transporter ATP-binding protein, partial [Cyclobacteriaceae bacterium]
EYRKVGMVFQDYALFPHLTVEANIQYGLHSWKRSDKEARLQEVLQWVNIQGLEKKYPHQLSGGQQQRVALARALAPQPSLLLLDEPFSNLDVQLKDQVREEVRRTIKLAGTTAIFVTHDIKDALSTADRIAVLRDGQLQQLGTPEQLYRSPDNVYVANFFGKTNLLEARREGAGLQTALGFIAGNTEVNSDFSGWVCLRPEEIEICSSQDSAMSGTVNSIHYFGDHLQLLLDINPEVRLWIKTENNEAYEPGQILHIKLDPSNFRFLDAK